MADLRNPRERVVGTRETLKRLAQGGVVAVYVARDAGPRVIQGVVQACTRDHIPLTYVPSMHELGRLCGIDVGAACAAVVSSKHG